MGEIPVNNAYILVNQDGVNEVMMVPLGVALSYYVLLDAVLALFALVVLTLWKQVSTS